MSSPTKDELKGGHPPAVKVGGMRVSQHPHGHNEKITKAEREKEEDEFQTEKSDEKPVVIAGVITKGDKDFPAAAVKAAHDKPLPTKEKPPQKGSHNNQNMNIKQPGRQ